ncbi:restriction endonuclease [Streptomyces sp. ST1015]|uniref:restriction endonuclease n=1 Tax=unclassified Streptomyces TaxID=2593676 RepID=UPI001CA61E95|nr:restriction endonuclease [Streptomyces sp. ST1015]QZZ32353.1 restriction endonuclease [Streptomyces sp. ST1015]
MAGRRGRRQTVRQRRRAGLWAAAAVAFLAWRWPWLPAALGGLAAAGGAGWFLWAAHRRARLGDLAWRRHEHRVALERSMAAVDALTWQDFERYVAELCRRDGCTGVSVVGGAGDLAADVVGVLPDGRRLVVQVKHYAPHRKVPSGDVQKFVGMAFAEHRADVALFVATCAFSEPARDLAVRHGIVALNRELFGAWNSGATLASLLPLGGRGGGPRRRRAG